MENTKTVNKVSTGGYNLLTLSNLLMQSVRKE